MTHHFDIIVEMDSEGNFVASVPALQGCQTQARSLEELMLRTREAIELLLEEQGIIAESLDFVGIHRVDVDVGVETSGKLATRMTLLDGIARGEDAIAEGRTLTHAEAMRRLDRWLD